MYGGGYFVVARGGGSESRISPLGGPRKGLWRTARCGRGAIPERVWQVGKCPVDVASEEGGMVRVSDNWTGSSLSVMHVCSVKAAVVRASAA